MGQDMEWKRGRTNGGSEDTTRLHNCGCRSVELSTQGQKILPTHTHISIISQIAQNMEESIFIKRLELHYNGKAQEVTFVREQDWRLLQCLLYALLCFFYIEYYHCNPLSSLLHYYDLDTSLLCISPCRS